MSESGMSDYPARQPASNWAWLMGLGIAWIIVGALAILAAGLATLATVIVFGWVLAVTGVVRIIHAFGTRIREGFFLDLLVGILRIVVGAIMIARPGVGAVTITLLLAAFFCVAGLYRLGFAFSTLMASRGWIVLSGLVSLALGILIFLQWPSSSIWVIGTFIGIDLIFEGSAMIALGSTLHRLTAPPGETTGPQRPLGA